MLEIVKHRNGLAEGQLPNRSLGTPLPGVAGLPASVPDEVGFPQVCRSLSVG